MYCTCTVIPWFCMYISGRGMSSSRERGKYVVYTRRRCLDRISSLPDELLAHVLSFLPTRCAVSTSVLSTRWRHLFTLSTSLCFDDTPCFDGDPYYPDLLRYRKIKKIEAGQKRRFKKFVEKVLELHQIVAIKKFSLVCQGDYDMSDISAWISFAVQKGVEDLHYEVNVQKDHEPPDDVFECETLVRLKMIGIGEYILEIPLSACFPRLKILHLDDLSISDDEDSVERLFSGCELLEELTLRRCHSDTHRHVMLSTRILKILRVESSSFEKGLFEIDAPNLTHLTHKYISGIKIVPSWKDSCSFAKAELYFSYDEEDSYTYDAIRYDFEVLKAAAHKVTELHFSLSSFELLLKLVEPEETPAFPRLSRLYLDDCRYEWKYVISLLDKSPQLEIVVFGSGLENCDRESEPPSKEPLPSFSCHAKVIEVNRFVGSECALLYVGHLLRNAGALKKLILRKFHTVDMEKELRICKVLLTLPKASKDCCIELTSPIPPWD